MGKVKRLELWWQLYRTSLPVWDLENFRPMDFCWHECTCTSSGREDDAVINLFLTWSHVSGAGTKRRLLPLFSPPCKWPKNSPLQMLNFFKEFCWLSKKTFSWLFIFPKPNRLMSWNILFLYVNIFSAAVIKQRFINSTYVKFLSPFPFTPTTK